MINLPLAELRETRLRKIGGLRDLGIDPYPSTNKRSHYAATAISDYEATQGKAIIVAGRLMSLRKQGALAFGHVQDQTGTIQIMLRRDSVASTDAETGTIGYNDLKLLDVGDIVEAAGTLGKTQRGEISVLVNELHLLTKSLRPLPDKWSGITDRELILRKRYLDTISEPSHRTRFEGISRLLFAARQFLNENGFLEFHTPVLQPQYGGGTARPFITHVNALDCRMYLAISHELYLKRLIVAGFDKVYTIGRYFRNEGIDRSHHPEFSMIETMAAFQNYEYSMDLVEGLFKRIARDAFGRTAFSVGEHRIDFAAPWERLSMVDAVQRVTGVDFRNAGTTEQANNSLQSLGISEPQPSIGAAIVKAFEERVESSLIQPTLIYGHPVEISPLAKPMAADPRYAERFEIFIAGMECGDNWSEENDPVQLHAAWERSRLNTLEEESHPLDYDFLESIEYGMPPTTGIGPGIERMAMIFAEQQDIYDVIFFPLMTPALSAANRAIYGVVEETAEAPVAKTTNDLHFSFSSFEDLLQQDVLRPQTDRFLLEPHLRIWPSQSAPDKHLASGHLEISGFLTGGKVILAGYQIASEEPLDTDAETRRYLDLIELSVASVLRKLFSNSTVAVKPVRIA